jgi:transglutaminase-like putative cysteine protease
MKKLIVVIALLLAISAGGLYLMYSIHRAEPQQLTFQIDQYTTFYIDENGNADGEWIYEIPPSYLADQHRLSIMGGMEDSFPVHGIGVENAKSFYIASLLNEYAKYGIEMENTSCEITGLNSGEMFKITITWKTPYLAGRYENKWRIMLWPVDNESFARGSINDVKNLQSTLSVLSSMAAENYQLNLISTISFVMPSGANITNENELLSIGTQSIDYGGGTTGTTTIYIQEIDEKPAVVTEDQSLITQQLITITPEEFLEASRFYPIDYTGIPLTHSFKDSASYAAIDLKFGRERNEYSVSFDGLELNITPYQLLYYSAKEVVILAENSAVPLLSGAQPITVLPPDNESGEWGAFLKTLTKDGYIALAMMVRDQIESTGKAPSTINSPIGNIRSRDALFTLLRIISFYNQYGKLPDNLLFAPAPVGNLIRDGAEIPANHAYFLLSTQYVITDTPRVNQIISEMRQLGYDNTRLAENLCKWVYENITYPVPPPLGWFTTEEILDTREGKCLDKANLYLALARTAGIPARRVTGFLIFEQVTPPFLEIAGMTPDGRYIIGHAWTEVYLQDHGWVFADPTGNLFRISTYGNRIYSSVEETWQEVLASYETTYGKLI